MPGPGRLRLALMLIGAGLAFAAAQSFAEALHVDFDVVAFLVACAFALPAAGILAAGADLGRATR